MTPPPLAPPSLDRILETCLYTDDLAAARDFYGSVLGLPLALEQPGRHVFFRCGNAMLLVFDPATTRTATGESPPHGATGPGHVAFAITPDDFPRWRDHLTAHHIPVETEIDWPRGGHSLYLRDPAGNSVELATPSVWSLP